MPRYNFFAKVDDTIYYIKFAKILYKFLQYAKFPKHFSKYSKRDFNNWQFFVFQVFRQKLKLKYRPFIHWLESSTSLTKFLKLNRIPYFTDFQDFDERCNIKWFHQILEQTPKVVGLMNLFVGTDGTGFSIYQGSLYYCRRVGKKIKKKHFIKVVAVSDLKEQLILCARIRKKSRHDNRDFKPLMRKVAKLGNLDISVGDKGFDDESNHELVRDELGALFIAPLRNEDVPVWRTKGYYRKKLKRYFPEKTYHQRSKKETILSVVKRCYGDTVYSHKFSNQKKDIMYRLIAYNVDRLLKKSM